MIGLTKAYEVLPRFSLVQKPPRLILYELKLQSRVCLNENISDCYTVKKKLQENKDRKGTVCRHYDGLHKWQVS